MWISFPAAIPESSTDETIQTSRWKENYYSVSNNNNKENNSHLLVRILCVLYILTDYSHLRYYHPIFQMKIKPLETLAWGLASGKWGFQLGDWRPVAASPHPVETASKLFTQRQTSLTPPALCPHQHRQNKTIRTEVWHRHPRWADELQCDSEVSYYLKQNHNLEKNAFANKR